MLFWELVFRKAKRLYGDPLPDPFRERLKLEQKQIETWGLEKRLLGLWKLITRCKGVEDMAVQVDEHCSHYLSLFLLGMTQVNPMMPHYICPRCYHIRFVPNAATQGELWTKACCTCGSEILSLGYDLPLEEPDAAWKPMIRVSASQLELLEKWNAELPPGERIQIEKDLRLELLHQMLRQSGIDFWEISPYDTERLDLFARPLMGFYDEDSCLGIEEIVSSHAMIKLLLFVNGGSLDELIRLSGCSLAGSAEAVLSLCRAGNAFEDLTLFDAPGLPSKAACIANALLALRFAYVKLVSPEVFYAVSVDWMCPDSWGCGDPDISAEESWTSANALLELDDTVPEWVTVEELAAYFDQCGKRIGQPFFGKELMLLTEISASPYAAETWELIDRLWF